MIKSVKVEIEGTTPLLLHNGMLADPLYPMVKELKKVTSKKTKTDADHEEMARLEWLGGLYTNAKGQVVIPGINIERCIVMGARKTRKGKDVECGAFVDGDIILEFPDKGKSVEKLYESGNYHDRRMVCVNRARVARTRPIFRAWSLAFSVQYDDEILNETALLDMIDTAGTYIGLCDFRPRFGRFQRVE